MLRRFLVIDPHECEAAVFEAASFDLALARAGLEQGRIDFGTVMTDAENVVQIVVAEHGMYDPKAAYFTLGKNLYAGRALVFQEQPLKVNYEVSLQTHRIKLIREALRFYTDATAVEQGIWASKVTRPSIQVNGKTYWEWPEPKPDLDEIVRETVDAMMGRGR